MSLKLLLRLPLVRGGSLVGITTPDKEEPMSLYCGVDLHSTNSYIVVLGDEDRAVLDKRLPNQLEPILAELEPFRESLTKIAIESTFNWYWLVDGLEDHGYSVQLVNTCAAKQYEGLKFRDDRHDARWIAHMLRLGILPVGHIVSRDERAVRDLLRRRLRVVQQKVSTLLQLKCQIANHTGEMFTASRLKKLAVGDLDGIVDPQVLRAISSSIHVLQLLETEIDELQKAASEVARKRPGFKNLRMIKGVGELLATTILYETGDIQRFASAGNYASYCRCVSSEHRSNGKKKGSGNRKNGNRYLARAFREAAHFAIRFQPEARSYYQRKKRKTNGRIAASTVAHKLARAVFFMLRDNVTYDPKLLFGAAA
jgi:transposase